VAETHKPPQPFTLRLRRYNPEAGDAPYWDEHTVELEPHRSVLEAILQAKDRFARPSVDRVAYGLMVSPRWPVTPTSTPPWRGPPTG